MTRLGVHNRALGFVAGFTGRKLEQMLVEEGIDCDFNRLKEGQTRINVKIKAETELDVNAQGPDINELEINELMEKLDDIKEGDFWCLQVQFQALCRMIFMREFWQDCKNERSILWLTQQVIC